MFVHVSLERCFNSSCALTRIIETFQKESLGMERALLVGLMANGVDEVDLSEMSRSGANDPQIKRSSASATSLEGWVWDKSPGSIEGEKKSSRLNLIVNDIVLIVELQHRIISELRQQTGLHIHHNMSTDNVLNSKSRSNSSKALLRLVAESIRPSEEMQTMQENLRLNFDVLQFQNVSSPLFSLAQSSSGFLSSAVFVSQRQWTSSGRACPYTVRF